MKSTIRFEATIESPSPFIAYGEQAGLLVMVDDFNWVKLAVERTRDETKVILAHNSDKQTTMLAKIPRSMLNSMNHLRPALIFKWFSSSRSNYV